MITNDVGIVARKGSWYSHEGFHSKNGDQMEGENLGFDKQFYYSKCNLYNGQGIKQKPVPKELSTWRVE